MDDELNLAQRHRFSGQQREKYPLWPVVLGLAVFWFAVIFTIRACTKDDLGADLGAGSTALFSQGEGL